MFLITYNAIDQLEKYCPEILDEVFTRTVEDEMEKIREEKFTPEKVLEQARRELDKIIEQFKKNEKKIGEALLLAHRETQDAQSTLGPCPNCKGGTLKIMYSPKTKKLG